MNAVPFVPVTEVPATNPMNFLAGAFDVGKWRIPYFATTLSFREAAEDLMLTNEMPGSDHIRWTVGELYQRDIDWARVQGEILKYLIDTDQPQFFNSITIALLPYREHGGDPINSFDDTLDWKAPKLPNEDNYGKVITVGPVKFGFFQSWDTYTDRGFQLGVVRWNPDQIHGVAIDGQHRLAAIKEFVRRGYTTDGRVPVLILLLDPRVGFEAPDETDMTGILRRLFIDLNKNAKTVSRARQILLDDRDPLSRCVRAFIANELRSDLGDLAADPPRYPLALVDWHSEQAKFNDGPYLTTVLGVDWMVSEILGQKTIQDLTAYDKLRDQIGSLGFRLNVDMSEALERLEAAEEQLRPFSFAEAELDEIAGGFASTWNGALAHLLTRFQPYDDFIASRQGDGSLSLEWQMWYRLRAAAKDRSPHSEQELREYTQRLLLLDPPVPQKQLDTPLEALDNQKIDNLAFNVAFQRAYIAAFSKVYQFTDADLDSLQDWASDSTIDLDAAFGTDEETAPLDHELDSADDSSVSDNVTAPVGREMDRATRFVKSMNQLLDAVPSLLEVRCEIPSQSGRVALWSGTLRKPDGGIDFALAASARASDLLFILVGLAIIKSDCPNGTWGFDDIWAELVDGTEWPAFKKLKWACDRLWKRESSMAGRILSAKEVPYSSSAAQAEVESRLHAVWKALAP